jgi:hypothetical protein
VGNYLSYYFVSKLFKAHMKTIKPTEPAVASDLSGLAAEAQAMLKAHVDTYTRKDGVTVQAHDDKRVAAQPEQPSYKVVHNYRPNPALEGAIHPLKASPADIEKKLGMGVGASSAKEGHYSDAHQITHKDGTRHAIYSNHGEVRIRPVGHNNKAATEALKQHLEGGGEKPADAKPAVPAIGANAKALRASSKDGDLDHDTNQVAATHMEAGDHKSLKSSLQSMDTGARDHVLDHIHPDHWEGLGFKPLNKDKSIKDYDAKFAAKQVAAKPADAPNSNGAPVKRVLDKVKAGHKTDATGLKASLSSALSAGDTESEDGSSLTYGDVKNHLHTMRTQLGGDSTHAQHLEHAQYALNQSMGGDKAPLSEKHAKIIGAALSGKTKIDDNGMVKHADVKGQEPKPAAKPKADKPDDASPAGGATADIDVDADHAHEEYAYQNYQKHGKALEAKGFKAGAKTKAAGGIKNGESTAYSHPDGRTASVSMTKNPGGAWDNKWKTSLTHGDSGGSIPPQSDSKASKWDDLPDEENPKHALSRIGSQALGQAAQGKDDLKNRAKVELANRGMDSDNKWVGFDKAKAHHGVETTKGDADEVGSHFQTIHGSVLSAAAKGHLDLNKQAKHQLASRGHDSSGNWLGFDKAKEHHFGADAKAPAKTTDAPKGKTMAKALFFVSPEGLGELQDMAKSQAKD